MNLLLKIIILIIIFNFGSYALAADSTANANQNIVTTVSNDFKRTAEDVNILSYKISKLDNRDLLYFTGIAAGTALSFLADDEIRAFSRKYVNKSNDKFYNITNKFGDGVNAVVFSGSIYLGGLLFGSTSVRTTGRLMLESIALSGIATLTLKYVSGRSRPYLDKGNADFNFFSLDDKFNSFPSGHTAMAFSMASVLSRQIDTWWAYAGLYSIASTTAAARIYYDKHWFSDVVLGAAIGIVSGNVICSSNKLSEYQHRKKDNTYLFYPVPNGIGFSMNF